MRDVLIVSHPAVLASNQRVYLELQSLGWQPTIVVPARWRHPYDEGILRPQTLAGLEGRVLSVPIVKPGKQQRHLYLARTASMLRRARPEVLFIEEECFSLPAWQWARGAQRAGVPFGIHAFENLDRPLPLPARAARRYVLAHASFAAARTPDAAELLRTWGMRARVEVVPPGVPAPDGAARPAANGTFTVGFAGRLTEEKGIADLLAAVSSLDSPVRLLVVGDGPLREQLARVNGNVQVELHPGVAPEAVNGFLRQMDVLALPSRTTPTWSEQFGRVIVEALAVGTPVIAADSGSIPWVIAETEGGLLVPEGDVPALATELRGLRDDRARRDVLGERGRATALRAFSVHRSATVLAELLTGAAQ